MNGQGALQILKQSSIASILWSSGDMITQKFIEGAKTINPGRSLRMMLFGFFYAGPTYYWWYRHLDRMTVRHAERPVKRILVKLFYDQLVFEPVNLGLFFVFNTLSYTLSLEVLWRKLKAEYINCFIVDCAVWPGTQALNFRFVSPNHQGVVVNVVTVFWAAFLSYMDARPHKK
eukprot:TRINITY_DN3309_c0_g1_i2.p2 TRINITY_DN3309_c0_g1~~TRINITY_DN3309_c0_g1_i2.p2  ORF type:complete len:174 (-),score=21.09 TRINITY_DN3309_c0_g1_i2:190-711(-)